MSVRDDGTIGPSDSTSQVDIVASIIADVLKVAERLALRSIISVDNER